MLDSSAYSFGSILAGLMASLLTASFMPDWAWRLGFAVALIAGILIFFLRIHVAETPEYLKIKSNEKLKLPFFEALKEAPLAITGVIGIAWLTGVMTFGTYYIVDPIANQPLLRLIMIRQRSFMIFL